MNYYTYDGPVEEFGRCICHNWRASTFAPSEKKARSNLAYQYKKQCNKTAAAKITLPGVIKLAEPQGGIRHEHC